MKILGVNLSLPNHQLQVTLKETFTVQVTSSSYWLRCPFFFSDLKMKRRRFSLIFPKKLRIILLTLHIRTLLLLPLTIVACHESQATPVKCHQAMANDLFVVMGLASLQTSARSKRTTMCNRVHLKKLASVPLKRCQQVI